MKNTFAKKFMVCALAGVLGFALTACDDSSSASSDETGVSSSSVESPDSSVTLSGASAESNGSSNENMEKDKYSSSVKGSEPVEVSSSSAKETKNSSDSKSSSSVKTDDSSSSNKDVSSSSVSSSSSENQSSSSSVKQSSSSVASSSSEYKPYNHQKFFSSDSLLSGAYKKFTDERNGRMYYYLTINGKNQDGESASVTVMAENLNIGEMVDGTKEQSNDSKIERYCYNDDTTNCDKYGGLYQWAEALQLSSECNTKSCAAQIDPDGDGFHQGICPKGWHLLTYDEFYIVVHADGNVNPLVEGVRAMSFGGHNYCGYSLIGAGYRTKEGNFEELNESAYWFYPSEHPDRFSATRGGAGTSSKRETGFYLGYNDKVTGNSIRCARN
ncbi:FISUMP domain-containing protein [uncultured Fibrobacter sp.]|uniref:FISUMP domain-containing protein n=1 Tax=uncultured Fibrobacter sp. TaxID=261512 RepID=UPI002611BB0B|nr:FISUMP domain-containing protein [uncultured Fibrobacter sp.]